jgi:anti-anti-sigma factor
MSSQRVAPQNLKESFDPDGVVRLTVAGEIDLTSAPALHNRLKELAAAGERVRLDLSGVDFIDSTGLHVLIENLADTGSDGWHLEIATNPSPAVMRIIQLSGAGPHLWPQDG